MVRAVDQSLNRSANSPEVTATPTGDATLVVHYEFEDDSDDSSINSNDSVVNGTAKYILGGVGASCLAMDGASTYVDLPAEVVNYDQITISAWVYWNGGGAWQRIFDFGNGTSDYLFLTPDDGSGMRFSIKHGGPEQTLGASALPSGQWTHVAVTLSNQTARLYVNGSSVDSSSSFTIKPSDFKPVLNYIGRSQYAADPLFNGAIDEFRIYNHVLNATELANLAAVPVTGLGTAEIVSWNMNVYSDSPTGASPTAGYGPADAPYWNDTYLDGLSSPASSLRDNTGAASTVDISWASGNGTWSIGTSHPGTDTDGTLNKEILNGYLNGGGGNTSSVTLSGIGYSSYDIYVYFSSDTADRQGTVSDGTTTYYFNTLGPDSINDASGNAVFGRAADTTTAGYAVAANYAVFSGLTGSTKSITCNIPNYGGIAAVQIVHIAPPAPPVPSGLSAVSSDAQIALSWNVATNATTYAIKYSLTNGGPYTLVAYRTTTNYVATGLANGTTYYYVVSSSGDGGQSADSDQVSAVPSAVIDSNEFYIGDTVIQGGTNLSLMVFNSVLGHDYGILATDTLTPPAWSNILIKAGTGSDLPFDIPISTMDSNRFFRLDVQRQ